ncbi:MAG: sugar transferase [bacterium]
MNQKLEKILLFVVDFVTINITLLTFLAYRSEFSFWLLIAQPEYLILSLVIYVYWFILFFFIGMYGTWFATSRIDELSKLFKSTLIGIFILFFLILYDDFTHNISSSNRFLIFLYWGMFLTFTGVGRLFVRSFQRKLLVRGLGRRNALLIGFNKKSNEIHDTIFEHKGLGLDVVAYVALNQENVNKEYKDIKVVGTIENLQDYITSFKVKEVIISLDKHKEEVVIDIINKCQDTSVFIKIVPDLYEIISGQARTSQIYGFPLINIMPQLMPDWEMKVKRIIDFSFAILFFIITLPITVIISAAIILESKGPVFYKQERSGLNGKPFKVYKFRSMVQDAEKGTGPMWSTKGDARITKVGKFIRKVRIDEIPQVFNILRGEMSLVGPRPERPFFVEKLAKEIPLYKRRLAVRPGLTGWAQVKHKYDETVEDVKMKLKYDLFYIENMSLRMDFKIIFRTVFVVLFGKGHY